MSTEQSGGDSELVHMKALFQRYKARDSKRSLTVAANERAQAAGVELRVRATTLESVFRKGGYKTFPSQKRIAEITYALECGRSEVLIAAMLDFDLIPVDSECVDATNRLFTLWAMFGPDQRALGLEHFEVLARG